MLFCSDPTVDFSNCIRKSISLDDPITGVWHYADAYDARTITQARCVNKYLRNFIDGTYEYICSKCSKQKSGLAIPKFLEQMRQATPLLGLCNKFGEWCYVTRPKQLKGDDFFYAPITIFAGNTNGLLYSDELYNSTAGFALFQFIKANNLSLNVYGKYEEKSFFSVELPNHPAYSRGCSAICRKHTIITIDPARMLGTHTVRDHSDLYLPASLYTLHKKFSRDNGNISILVNPFHQLF